MAGERAGLSRATVLIWRRTRRVSLEAPDLVVHGMLQQVRELRDKRSTVLVAGHSLGGYGYLGEIDSATRKYISGCFFLAPGPNSLFHTGKYENLHFHSIGAEHDLIGNVPWLLHHKQWSIYMGIFGIVALVVW